ncbi:MAG: LacI family DNA-binding transcriptional regulator [Limnobaculum xujianqingii]
MRPATLEDVAREAGLSAMTVSRAINTPQVVRPKTVEKVMAAVRATGYIPNALAGGLASKRSKLIAVVVPQINNSMFVDTIQSISDELARRGYHMLLCVAGYTHESEAEIVTTILSRRPDGIVLTGIHHSPELRKTVLNASIPVVEIWDLTPTPLDMLVGFSHEKVGYAIGQYLLNKGYRRFGLIWTEDRRAAQRKNGVCELLAQHGVDTPTEVLVPLPASLKLGREACASLLESDAVPDVLVCSSDTLAQGAIVEAMHRGMRVPEDIAVMGFGDLDFAAFHEPAITTVGIDRWGVGKRATDMLLEKLAGGFVSDPIVDVGFVLIERHSA